jgi:DNA-binding transcriptional regulator YiaG
MHGRNSKRSQDAKDLSSGTPREEHSLIEALKLFVEASRLRGPRVAQLIGVGETTLSNWLKGTARPTRKKMLVIESFLRCHRRK